MAVGGHFHHPVGAGAGVLIAIYPRWSEASEVVYKLTRSHRQDCFAIALAEDEQSAADFRRSWPDDCDQPLLLLMCQGQDSITLGVDAVCEIGKRKAGRPLGVLVADGPDAYGFGQRADWNRAFSRAVAEAIVDVQIFEYTPTWAHSPPRIR